MSLPSPPHWTFAARAAYFGDRMCAFCDHRNPAGAKFCNQCASPLDLRPCTHCDALNERAATVCGNCGAACPVIIGAPMTTPAWPVVDATRVCATPGDLPVAASVKQPLFAASAYRAGWRRLAAPRHFLVAAIVTVMIVGAYHAYRIDAGAPDAMRVVSQPYEAPANDAATATAAVQLPVESTPVEAEGTRAVEKPIPASSADEGKHATVRQRAVRMTPTRRAAPQERPVPVPATKHASAHQRMPPERHAPTGTAPRVARGPAVARVDARAQTSRASRTLSWPMTRVKLARCDGDLIARILCDQRVRRHYCEGRWGAAPGCVGGIVNDHGQ